MALAACSSAISVLRTDRSSRCIPRAIAPDVTTTTSTPVRCSSATSSQTRATTDSRSSPESWATTDEPSLTTATDIERVRLRRPGRSDRRTGVELEHDAAQLDVVAGFEPARLERSDHSHPTQTLLDMRERLLVLHVVAGDQPVDRLAGDPELALADALHVERSGRRRAEQLELGDVILAGALVRDRLGGRHAPQQLARERVEPLAGRARGHDHGHSLADPRAPLVGRRAGLLGCHEVG